MFMYVVVFVIMICYCCESMRQLCKISKHELLNHNSYLMLRFDTFSSFRVRASFESSSSSSSIRAEFEFEPSLGFRCRVRVEYYIFEFSRVRARVELEFFVTSSSRAR